VEHINVFHYDKRIDISVHFDKICSNGFMDLKMRKNNLKRSTLALLVTLALSACGGSGGGENGSGGGNVPAPTINLTNINVDVQEAGEAKVAFTLSNAGAAAIVSATSNNPLVKVDVEGKTLKVYSPSVDKDTPVEIALEVKFGGQRGNATLKLNIVNTSIISAYEEADAFVTIVSSDYQDEIQLFNYASQVGYTSGFITRSQRDNYQNLFSASLSEITVGLTIMEELLVALDSYQSALSTETDFRATLADLVNRYNETLTTPNSIAHDLFGDIGQPFSSLSMSGNTYESGYKAYSQFLTSETGVFDGQNWQFNSDFAFLEDVLPSFNLSQLCLAASEGV